MLAFYRSDSVPFSYPVTLALGMSNVSTQFKQTTERTNAQTGCRNQPVIDRRLTTDRPLS
jgi:hypothetical protein